MRLTDQLILQCQKRKIMKLLHDLFFTDYGLMSFIGLVFMLGMGVFFLRLFLSGAQTQP